MLKKADTELRLARKTIISKEIHNEIGMNYRLQRLHNKAIQQFEKAIGYYPAHFDSYFNLGLANKKLSRLQKV